MDVKYDKHYCTDCHFPKDCCFRGRNGKCRILLDAYNEDCGFAKPHRDARPYRMPPKPRKYIYDGWPYC